VIEDSGSSGSDAQKMQKSMEKYVVPGSRGRKPKYESRAPEFRRKLLTWRHTPDHSRPSLRALARELGTSHQMLAYCFKGLEEWEHKERSRQERKQAEEIRARAEPETRQTTP
jgi:hypothetical protein